MASADEYRSAATRFSTWALGYDSSTTAPGTWARHSREGNSGAFLTPIDESMHRAGGQVAQIGADLRRLAMVCTERAVEIDQFLARRRAWIADYADAPIGDKPRAPVWSNAWSYR